MAKRQLTPTEIARSRRMNILTARGYAGLLVKLCVIPLAVWILFSQVFLITQADGQGMFPAIEDGDLVLAYCLHSEYAKGDVIVYQVDGATYLGRIVAKETDVVMIDDSGTLVINGTTQGGEIMYPTYAKEPANYPLRVQEGSLYVLGDYRTQTQDSRDFGAIPLDDILGKVITIVRRRGV